MANRETQEMMATLPAIRDIIGVQVTSIGKRVGCSSAYISYACQGVRPLPRKYQGQVIKQLKHCAERLEAVPFSAYEMRRVIDDCCINVKDLARKLGVSNTTLISRLNRETTHPDKLAEVRLILQVMGRDLNKAVGQIEKARSVDKIERA